MELDVTGLVCPQPVAIVRRCLAELDAGEEITVIGDYPPAARSIRRTCYKHGYRVADQPTEGEDEFKLVIQVTEDATLSRDEETIASTRPG